MNMKLGQLKHLGGLAASQRSVDDVFKNVFCHLMCCILGHNKSFGSVTSNTHLKLAQKRCTQIYHILLVLLNVQDYGSG
jgi:hypothetical protein